MWERDEAGGDPSRQGGLAGSADRRGAGHARHQVLGLSEAEPRDKALSWIVGGCGWNGTVRARVGWSETSCVGKSACVAYWEVMWSSDEGDCPQKPRADQVPQMQQNGLQKDIARVLGGEIRASEIPNRQRKLSMQKNELDGMAQA